MRAIDPPELRGLTKPAIVLSLDPGVTTGWALVRVRDRAILATGTSDAEDLGEMLDETVRSVHREGYRLLAVVESPPTGRTYLGDDLDVVQRTVAHWLQGVFGLVPTYITPGEWKPSRVARRDSSRSGISAHERDAIRMALYYIDRGGA